MEACRVIIVSQFSIQCVFRWILSKASHFHIVHSEICGTRLQIYDIAVTSVLRSDSAAAIRWVGSPVGIRSPTGAATSGRGLLPISVDRKIGSSYFEMGE